MQPPLPSTSPSVPSGPPGQDHRRALPATSPADRPSGRLSYGQFLLRLSTVAAVVVSAGLAALLAGLILMFGLLGASSPEIGPLAGASSVGGTEGAPSWVLVVPVEGPILSSGGGGFVGATGGQETRSLLEDAATDDRVAAVVLELSTPGGTIPGSIDIAAGVKAVQSAGKPVVAYVRDLSASGGMWAMAPADRIIAHPGSVVGSIGVLFGPLRQYIDVTAVDDGLFGGGVVTSGGVSEFYITAGRSKDVGNPYRQLTTQEQLSLQRFVDGAYDDFVAHVAEHRPVLPETVRSELGAMVFRAAEAEAIGLVDEVGSRSDAWASAAALAELDDYDVRAVRLGGGLLAALLGGQVSAELTGLAVQSELRSLCGVDRQAFLYHGDLAAFCRRAGS